MPSSPVRKSVTARLDITGSASQRELAKAELNRLLEDPLFRRSNRYSALLAYIVTRTMEGGAAEIKERTIGVEVFHRSSDYDTNVDPVVRFCAAEVRKRLAQYYRIPRETLIEIDLPIGSYVPRFYSRGAVQPEESSFEPLPFASPVQHPAVEAVPRTGPESHRKLFWGFAAAVLILLTIAAGYAYRRSLKTDAAQQFWEPLLDKATPVQIVTGTPPPDGRPLPDNDDLTIKEHFLQPGHKVSFATASAISELSGFLEGHQQPFSLTEAEVTSIDNLRHRPLILVNANNNRWTLFMLRSLRFHFESNGDTGYIIDSEHPDRKSWKVDFTRPYLDQNEDYAIVARFSDPTTMAPVLVVAGIGSNGTQAAGDFVISPTELADFARKAPSDWYKHNFEVLLKVQVVQGHLGATQIASTHFW